MIRAFAALTAVIAVGLCGGTALASGASSEAAGVAFVKPLTHAWISQGFGCTSFAFEPVDRVCPGGHWHSGIDLAAARGTQVMATLPVLSRSSCRQRDTGFTWSSITAPD